MGRLFAIITPSGSEPIADGFKSKIEDILGMDPETDGKIPKGVLVFHINTSQYYGVAEMVQEAGYGMSYANDLDGALKYIEEHSGD